MLNIACHHSLINWIAAGLRLPRSSHGKFLSLYHLFRHSLYNILTLVGCRTRCPTDLQCFVL